jgi:hypothetical protein
MAVLDVLSISILPVKPVPQSLVSVKVMAAFAPVTVRGGVADMSLTSLFQTASEPMQFSNYNRKQTGRYSGWPYKFVMQPRVALMHGQEIKNIQ